MADFDLLPAHTQVPSSSTKFASIHIPINVALLTTMLALNKVTRIGQLPKGFVLTGVGLMIPIFDSNGSPLLTWSLGDSGLAGRYIAASTKGRTSAGSTSISDLVVAGMLFESTAKTDLLFTCTAAAATAVAGTIKGSITGYIK